MTINVVFVCLGNICRSPSAQGIFESMVESAGLSDTIKVDSCGTASFNVGKSPDPRSIAAAKKAGYDISQQIARQIDDADYENGNYVIAMDRINLTNVQAWAPEDYAGEINLFMHYQNKPGYKQGNKVGSNSQIPDPYYDDSDKFDSVISMLEGAASDLLAYIIEKHQLNNTH